jgi:hypothetical protein
MELSEEHRRAIRTAARERKRKQRERDLHKRVRALEAQKAASERAERRRRNLHCYGECAAGRNADNLVDELMIHRQFLRALGEPDVRNGERLHSVAQRTYYAWITGPFASRGCDGTIYVPAFNGTTQQFDPDFGFVLDDISFDELWSAPKDCSGNEIISTEALPNLPTVPKTSIEEKTVSKPKPNPPSPMSIVPQEQPNAIHFAYVPPRAYEFLNRRSR